MVFELSRIVVAGTCLMSLLFITGCASVTQGSVQAVKVETLGTGGEIVDGAECRLSNEKGIFVTSSGASVIVGRAAGDLSVRCTLPGRTAALGTAVSRSNAGLAGNILFGGLIGAAVDASTGAAFSYPSWMQLVFGEERLFDRSGNRHEGPVAGQFVRALADAGRGPAAPSAVAAGVDMPSKGTSARGAAVVREGRMAMQAPLQRGDALVYSLVDDLTGSRTPVYYTLDRSSGEEMSFNSGSKTERRDGQVVAVRAAVGGLFDSAMPTGGWTRASVQPGQTWSADSAGYSLRAHAIGESTFTVDDEVLTVIEIRYAGWQTNATQMNGATQRNSPVKFAVLYAPELKRVVRFNGEIKAFGATARETLELKHIQRN